MLSKSKILYLLIPAALIVWCYANWLFSPIVLGNDMGVTNYEELYSQYLSKPTVWYSHLGNGFGSYSLLPLIYYWVFFIQLNLFKPITDIYLLNKLIFLWPILVAGVFSTYLFTKTFLNKPLEKAIFTVIFLLNPYIMMLSAGGQAGVATAYMLTPGVIAASYLFLKKTLDKSFTSRCHQIRFIILYAILLLVISMYDSRILYINVFAILIMSIGLFLSKRISIKAISRLFLPITMLGTIFIGLHALWLVPSLVSRAVDLPEGYVAATSTDFFSFARLAHTITLSHPNYPDNIFGETKEVRGLSFIFPLLAFWQLRKPNKRIIYFSILALAGVFLAKGTNPPLGQLYEWGYNSVPFMNLYRDSTKFFVLIGISYSSLIALTLQEIWDADKKLLAPNIKKLLVVVVVLLITITWWPTISRQLPGTFKYRTMPPEYNDLRTLLSQDTSYGRVLWIPTKESFGYTSINHPAVNFLELTRAPTCIPRLCIQEKNWPENYVITQQDRIDEINESITLLQQGLTSELLQDLGIKYIAIAADKDELLYRHDRKFAPFIREEYRRQLDEISEVEKIIDNSGLSVYKTQRPTSLVSATNTREERIPLQTTSRHPTEFTLLIDQSISNIIFSQSFDKNWQLLNADNTVITNSESKNNINFYPVQLSPGTYTLKYQGQSFAEIGYQISIATLLITLGTLFIAQMQIRRIRSGKNK